MCGIAGILHQAEEPVREEQIRRMLAMIRHRGPDEFGIFLGDKIGLGSARLSIIDLSSGQQPISNEDGTLWIVFNGEIFNHVELRPELEARGHRFTTQSDTEVLLHLYEEFGSKCLERLNGQFAFAIWDENEKTLFLARDRLGIRPLFFTFQRDNLIFASEIKALLTDPRVRREIDTTALDQTFTFWAPLSPRTAFRGIFELPPAHFLLAHHGEIEIENYWQLDFPDATATAAKKIHIENVLEEFSTLLVDATKIRLRADVPVGAYLSGGLDSSLIAFMVQNFTGADLDTFSIAFDDAQFDESFYQQQMARQLGTKHQIVHATHADIGSIFPEVVWHTEVPLMRTAPAPMFLLSKLVRDCGYKVVLTGEGADEFLAGYDIFKEAKIRRFWARQPESQWRPLLFQRLYADVKNFSANNAAMLAAFFREDLLDVDAPDFSHAIRWRNNRRTRRFFSDAVLQNANPNFKKSVAARLPMQFRDWEPLARAQFLEIKIFLSQYLLSSQGDRMAMAHSVEGRFPFLDFRVVEFCNQLPSKFKLRGLTEKFLLKQLGKKWLPPEIWQRRKRPYRAPIQRSFFNGNPPDYVRELLSPERLKEPGLFNPTAVEQLVAKIENEREIGETDEMALAGILSTQLLHELFIRNFKLKPPLSENDPVKVCVHQPPLKRQPAIDGEKSCAT
ncbi:MAG TPA: asparagine synthase (glutamine-hydrolyzing) [Verrucomicrobiae bacterium]|nr:asparagine synthase (glutamine-hydrolyzing) [Verrucomicrobiae bacterium]